MHKNAYSKMKWFKETYLNIDENLDILDVNSIDSTGEYDYKEIFNEKEWKYTLLSNQSNSKADVIVYDIYNWYEIEDDSYDVIVSSHFFEHLEFFWLTMNQIERVLNPGGLVCIIVPSAGPKHGGNMLNCYRFQEDGLRAMANYVDLEVINATVDTEENTKPWFDACLIAKKSGLKGLANSKDLENRMNNLESKLDKLLERI